jgi:acyl transferase domain-containing protein
MTELEAKLKGYLAGGKGIEGLYQGEVRREKDTLAEFASDEDFTQVIAAWVAKGKYGKLLQLWVKGLSFDWKCIYGAARPRRISLPTYPFARVQYRIEAANEQPRNVVPLRAGTNEFDELAYAKLLDGVVSNTVSIAAAIKETEKLLSASSEG